MSVITRNTVKALLPRTPHQFWRTIREFYPDDPETWRRLAMLALREDALWTLGRIARAFERSLPEVEDSLAQLKRDLGEKLLARDPFDAEPEPQPEDE